MSASKYYPYFLVTLQMGSLMYYAVSGPIIADSIPGILIECAGIFLAIHAIYIIKIRNVNIAPIVKTGSELVTNGPYKYIRHPMYIAQIITIVPLLVENFTYVRLGVLILLIFTLLFKIQYEEKQLVRYFPEYESYRKTTWKIIPFIY